MIDTVYILMLFMAQETISEIIEKRNWSLVERGIMEAINELTPPLIITDSSNVVYMLRGLLSIDLTA